MLLVEVMRPKLPALPYMISPVSLFEASCGAEVADRVGKVHLIEEIEELSAELDLPRLPKTESA